LTNSICLCYTSDKLLFQNTMLSITDYVRQIVDSKPIIGEMLVKNYLNMSNFADDIIPDIEKLAYKKITKNSVVMALSRIKDEIQINKKIDFKVNDISVKYPLSEINYPIPLQFCTKEISEIYNSFAEVDNHFLNIVSGNSETTIFVNSKLKSKIFDSFKKKKHNLELDNLASVSLKFSIEYFEVIGITYEVLRAMTWNKINLVEVVSTYTEITLIIYQKDTQKLIDILNKEFL
jgi:aspartokinase